MKTGCPMHIVSRIPCQKKLSKGYSKELSKKANHRLQIIDWYNQNSAYKSVSGKKDASLTCRHFGIERSYFYRWYARFKKYGIEGLEEKSRRPKRVRTETVCPEIVEEIKRIRQKNPTYSAKKIRPILLRYYEDYEVPSVSTISNVIKRHNFFFRADTKSFRKRSKSGQKAFVRRRISGNLRSDSPNKVIEFDMKHIRIPNNGKKYAMVGIDVYTKQSVIHVSNTCTSTAGKIAYQKVVSRFGKQAVYINDNGSENQDKAEQWLKDEGITQLWARPRTPKDKPCVERMIETLQVECLDYLEGPMNVTELQAEIDSWLKKYHGYRPHESLGFLTPNEFLTKFYLNSSPGVRVS